MTDSIFKQLGLDTTDREGIDPAIDGDSIIIDPNAVPPLTLTDVLTNIQSALEQKADLNAPNGVVVDEQLPNLATSEQFDVNSQAAQLALNARRGDYAVRLDQNGIVYRLARDSANVFANWTIVYDPNQGSATPSGTTVDEQFTPGLNQLTFNLSQIPLNIIIVTVNGDVLSEDDQYTVVGQALTLQNLGYALDSTDFVRVVYTA
ncbi:MAG: hypothetical protein MJH10_09300 [Epibacterium sp.]|nr:hypothetical protein [Epibacterium sp.]NQX73731.1 hypothetical protein [Epibacterium sp.]